MTNRPDIVHPPQHSSLVARSSESMITVLSSHNQMRQNQGPRQLSIPVTNKRRAYSNMKQSSEHTQKMEAWKISKLSKKTAMRLRKGVRKDSRYEWRKRPTIHVISKSTNHNLITLQTGTIFTHTQTASGNVVEREVTSTTCTTPVQLHWKYV